VIFGKLQRVAKRAGRVHVGRHPIEQRAVQLDGLGGPVQVRRENRAGLAQSARHGGAVRQVLGLGHARREQIFPPLGAPQQRRHGRAGVAVRRPHLEHGAIRAERARRVVDFLVEDPRDFELDGGAAIRVVGALREIPEHAGALLGAPERRQQILDAPAHPIVVRPAHAIGRIEIEQPAQRAERVVEATALVVDPREPFEQLAAKRLVAGFGVQLEKLGGVVGAAVDLVQRRERVDGRRISGHGLERLGVACAGVLLVVDAVQVQIAGGHEPRRRAGAVLGAAGSEGHAQKRRLGRGPDRLRKRRRVPVGQR